MTCDYCGVTSINYPMYVIRKAVKPKGSPHRYIKSGYCCEECYDKGKKIFFEYNLGK